MELIVREYKSGQYDTSDYLFKSMQEDTLPTSKMLELRRFSTEAIYERLKVIYGEDNRFNIDDEIVPSEIRQNAGKVACLIKSDRIRKISEGFYALLPEDLYGVSHDLCREEQFFSEPVVSFGSGFAISDNLFVTAGHCLESKDSFDFLIVYGYLVRNGETVLKVRQQDVYKPIEIVDKKLLSVSGEDYAVLKVNRPFPKERIVQIRQEGYINPGELVHVVGYPNGLPLKISLQARVYDNSSPLIFKINSDTYKGNSGSPVFNSKTNIVEGIFIDGHHDFDFIPVNGCHRSARCPKDIGGCDGEGVTRASALLKYIGK